MKTIKNKHSFSIYLLFIFGILVLFIVEFSSFKNKKIEKLIPSTPTPALQNVSIKHFKNNQTRVIFPTYNMSLTIPINLKTMKELDPASPYTQISNNNIVLYTDDSIIDKQSGYQTQGLVIAIRLDDSKNVSPNPNNSGNPGQTATDVSAIPHDNALVSSTNTRVYSSPPVGDAAAWIYTAEVTLKNNADKQGIYIRCLDYNNYQSQSKVCHNIIKDSLSSLRFPQ